MGFPSTSLRRAALLLLPVFAACASTDYHFSQLTGERYFKAPIDTYPVAIVRVDGKSSPLNRPTLVDPGVREITVQGPPGGAGGYGLERKLTLNVLPCTRYHLVAVKANRLASDFEVRVDHQEAISGCTPPPAA